MAVACGAVAKTLYEALDGLWDGRPLAWIDLSGRRLDDDDALALARALRQRARPELQVLDLRLNRIGSPGAAALARALQSGCCPGLVRLSLELNGEGMGSPEALAAVGRSLAWLPALEVLELGGNHITSPALVGLVQGLRAPGGCARLQVLDLFDNRLGSTALGALARAAAHCPELSEVDARVNWVRRKSMEGVQLLGPATVRW